jgi:hypothetical protein
MLAQYLMLAFGFFLGPLIVAIGVLAIIGWMLDDPLLFLPLIVAIPIVIGLWAYDYGQWSALLGFATLLVQAFVAEEYQGRSKELWSDFRRYLCRLLGGA